METKKWIKPDNVELPIEADPPVKVYAHHAFPLSVMCTDEDFKNYYHANFIQLIYNPYSGCAFDFHEFQFRHLPYFLSDRLDDSMTKQMGREINEFISMQIVNRYYCAAWVDAFYIPNELFYQKRHITHGILIFSYNDVKREYQAMAFTNHNSKYGVITVPYECFNEAYQSEHFAMLDFFKINKYMKPILDKTQVYKKIAAYASSSDYDIDDIKMHPKMHIALYGRKAFVKMTDYLSDCFSNRERIDLRYVYLVREHKKKLSESIKLINEGRDNGNTNVFNEIDSLSERLIQLSIMYNIKQGDRKEASIMSCISRILELEEEILQKMGFAVC